MMCKCDSITSRWVCRRVCVAAWWMNAFAVQQVVSHVFLCCDYLVVHRQWTGAPEHLLPHPAPLFNVALRIPRRRTAASTPFLPVLFLKHAIWNASGEFMCRFFLSRFLCLGRYFLMTVGFSNNEWSNALGLKTIFDTKSCRAKISKHVSPRLLLTDMCACESTIAHNAQKYAQLSKTRHATRHVPRIFYKAEGTQRKLGRHRY